MPIATSYESGLEAFKRSYSTNPDVKDQKQLNLVCLTTLSTTSTLAAHDKALIKQIEHALVLITDLQAKPSVSGTDAALYHRALGEPIHQCAAAIISKSWEKAPYSKYSISIYRDFLELVFIPALAKRSAQFGADSHNSFQKLLDGSLIGRSLSYQSQVDKLSRVPHFSPRRLMITLQSAATGPRRASLLVAAGIEEDKKTHSRRMVYRQKSSGDMPVSTEVAATAMPVAGAATSAADAAKVIAAMRRSGESAPTEKLSLLARLISVFKPVAVTTASTTGPVRAAEVVGHVSLRRIPGATIRSMAHNPRSAVRNVLPAAAATPAVSSTAAGTGLNDEAWSDDEASPHALSRVASVMAGSAAASSAAAGRSPSIDEETW